MATATKTRRKKDRSERTHERNALVTKHMRLVRHVLDKISQGLPRHVDREDLLEAGMMGLIDAAGRYDPDRGVRFSTYAVTRIRGAILDALRREDWLPRSLRNEVTSMHEARSELEHKNSRPPTDEELSRKLGVHRKKLTKLTRASARCNFQSLDTIPEDTLTYALDPAHPSNRAADAPDERAILAEQKERLADAIGILPETERLVVTLYYFEQLLLRDIGKVLRVSDSRVCQIHRRALTRLQRCMAEPETEYVALASAI